MSILTNEDYSLETDLPRYPHLVDALACWDRWRGDAPAPTWPDVHLSELPPPVIPSTIVADVIDGGRDLVFRFWGTAMVELYDAELSGKRFTDVADRLFGTLPHKQYQRIIDEGQPRLFRVTIRRPNDIIAERVNLRLPIVDNEGLVDKIMTVADLVERSAL